MPLFVTLDGRRVPALGLALTSAEMGADIIVERDAVILPRTGIRVPFDGAGRALLRPTDGLPRTSLGGGSTK